MSLRERRLDDPDCLELDRELQAYYAEVFGGPDATPTDPDEFAAPRGQFFVGYVEGRPGAMGGWRFVDAAATTLGSRPAELKRMYVAADWRRRGLARQLLARLEESARAAGADALVLETGNFLFDAIGLYRSSGYVDIAAYGYYAAEPRSLHLGKLLDSL
jgi:ribosomal protein S18 acetylase RimI-like enzyme